MNKLPKTYQIALKAAIKASEAIMQIYKTAFEKEIKADGSPVTVADLTASKIIAEMLSETGIPITGEELTKKPYKTRVKWMESWCVDPLDGTKEFIKKNGEFVVNIAHIKEGKPVFGIIVSPVSRKVIVGGHAIGKSYKFSFDTLEESNKWESLMFLRKINDPLVVVSSRSHYSGDLLQLINSIENKHGKTAGAQMGSALKFFDLVTGKADIYPRYAPTMEWDIAAGQAIYEVLGGEILDVATNKPLTYNKENLKNPHFVARKKVLTFPLSSND